MCPASGEVRGTIHAAQVLAQAPQGFVGGTLEELLAAIRGGAAYVNVHSELFAPGEIRGHLPARGHRHD
jgi:hypothetical protein